MDQQAGHHIGQERDNCAGDGIGQLGGHMIHMVALSAGRGHDGGVGDGGAVVAANRTSHTGGNADDAHRILQGEDCHSDGDQDAEGTPRSTGSKRQETADQKDDGGQEEGKVLGIGLDKVIHKLGGAQGVGHGLQGPGEGEDHDGRNHGLKALGDALHHLLEAHGPAQPVEHQGEQQAERGT